MPHAPRDPPVRPAPPGAPLRRSPRARRHRHGRDVARLRAPRVRGAHPILSDRFRVEMRGELEHRGARHPVFTIASGHAAARKRVLVLAGVHGNEQAGLLAIPDVLDAFHAARDRYSSIALRRDHPGEPGGCRSLLALQRAGLRHQPRLHPVRHRRGPHRPRRVRRAASRLRHRAPRRAPGRLVHVHEPARRPRARLTPPRRDGGRRHGARDPRLLRPHVSVLAATRRCPARSRRSSSCGPGPSG